MPSDRHLRRTTASAAGLSTAALLLGAACGTDRSTADDGPAPLPDDTYQRVLAQGVDPDLVHTIELPGFELAEQSAGVLGAADYGATYVPTEPPHDTEVRLVVRTGTYDGARCAGDPLATAGGSTVPVASCASDDAGWYRTGGGWHEYVVLDAGHVLTISAPATAVGRGDLVEAALGARHQDGGTIAPKTPSSPVPRGDLPTTGDGAPVDPYDPDSAGG